MRPRQSVRAVVAGSLLAGYLALAPASALAATNGIAPERWGGTNVDQGSGFDCTPYGGNFLQSWDMVETLAGTTFFSASGDPVRDIVQVQLRETDTRSDTGASLVVKGSWTVTWDHVADTVTVTGAFRVGTGPSVGIVMHDTGRLAVLADGLFLAGPKDAQFDRDGAYCRALAALR
jgi:hypothetical protein